MTTAQELAELKARRAAVAFSFGWDNRWADSFVTELFALLDRYATECADAAVVQKRLIEALERIAEPSHLSVTTQIIELHRRIAEDALDFATTADATGAQEG